MSTKFVRRVFDLELKLELVKGIEKGKLSVREVSTSYGVSTSAVYKWLRKYSRMYQQSTRVIVEKKSLSKKNSDLRAKVAELERALGQKQMRIDYLEKVVEVASEELGVEIEKKSKRRS